MSGSMNLHCIQNIFMHLCFGRVQGLKEFHDQRGQSLRILNTDFWLSVNRSKRLVVVAVVVEVAVAAAAVVVVAAVAVAVAVADEI